MTGELLGPGDVVAVNRSMISRVEPQARPRRLRTELHAVPRIRRCGFPVAFLARQRRSPRGVKPWLVLIALTADEFEIRRRHATACCRASGSGPDPVAARPRAILGVRARAGGAAAEHDTGRRGDGRQPAQPLLAAAVPAQARGAAGLHLFLVPAYEAGRLSGLGIERNRRRRSTRRPGRPARTTPVMLPVYFQSRFVTDAMEDIETLLRRLKPLRPTRSRRARRRQRASAAGPGYYPATARRARVSVQGALRQAGTPTAGLETDPALTDLVTATLARSDRGRDAAARTSTSPIRWSRSRPTAGVIVPRRRYRARAPGRAGRWFDLINLDLKFRHAAGLGAETVRRNQEIFAKRCWEQYEESRRGEPAARATRRGRSAGGTLTDKHVAKLAPDTLLALAEPLQPYVRASAGAAVVADLSRDTACLRRASPRADCGGCASSAP